MADSRARMARASLFLLALPVGACQLFVNDADREVYRLVEKRQIEAVGVAHDSRIDTEKVPIKPGETAYDFVPHPVEPEPPQSFTVAAPTSAPAEAAAATQPANNGVYDAQAVDVNLQADSSGVATQPEPEAPATQPDGTMTSHARDPKEMVAFLELENRAEKMTLAEALAYSFQHARDFQDAKEDLYLAALALTLERHLWTPQLVGDIRSQYANFGEIRDFDHAMDAVSRVAVEQRLPYGGRVTAEMLGSLMRDLTNHVTTGETGQALLTAEIPLLRGAGPVAYETRYRAERELIYAIRTFERFRRSVAVSVASGYFEIQQLRQQITNAAESIRGLDELARRSRALFRVGMVLILDVQRAETDLLNATNDLIDAIERYRTAMDAFKLRIGMPTETNLAFELLAVAASQPAGMATEPDAASAELVDELAMPGVDETEAVRVALKYRLDLLNDLDRIGDAERGVKIAENAILPELNVFGSVRFDTDPDKLGIFEYEHSRTISRGGINLELPLDRKEERNALRESLINKRRAERNYELARDTVVQQVRRAMRRVVQQQESVDIQVMNLQIAQRRLLAARLRFQKGLLQSFEVVDAQNELLRAQNRLAQAQATYKVAILEFWRDTDTLKIGDDGHWEFNLAPAPANG